MKRIAFTFFFLGLFLNGFSQDFIDENTMRLDEISVDKKYGYKASARKAIKVGFVKNEYKFINALTGPNGEQITAQRLGSCCGFKSKAAAFGNAYLDRWEITYDGLGEPIILYLNAYDYEKPKCPAGLGFKKE